MTTDWQAANRAYLDGKLTRFRLVIKRRVLWLREGWRQDALHEYPGLVIADAQVDRLLELDQAGLEEQFYATDQAASALGAAAADLGRHLEARAEAMAASGGPAAALDLARRFALTDFERDTLLLCLAPAMDASFERLYAYLHDDVSRKQMSPHLAAALLAAPNERAGLVESFLPAGRLISHRLLELQPDELGGAALGHRSLNIPTRIAAYLIGCAREIDRSLPLRPLPRLAVTSTQKHVSVRLAHAIVSRAGAATPMPAVNLFGRPEAAPGMALMIGDELDLAMCELDLDVGGLPDRATIETLDRECRLLGLGLFIDASRLERAERASLLRSLDRVDALIVVSSPEPLQWGRAVFVTELPRLGPALQAEIWRHELADAWPLHAETVAAITQQYDFGPEAITRAVARARASTHMHPETSPDGGLPGLDIWQVCRSQVGAEMGDGAHRIHPVHTLDDIVLPTDVLDEILDIGAQVASRPRVHEAWGFGRRLVRGAGVSALFSGPSGTGKTMAAEILAGRLELDLYRIDLAGVVSKYIGETEKNLKRVFESAEKVNGVLLFDEADALFGKRSEVRDSHDRYANIEIDYLLQRMEEYRGLAILATNRKTDLDRAFMRRLRFLVEFPFPDAASRLQIWKKAFPPEAPLQDIDFEVLARLELTGGSISNISVNAAFLAAHEGSAITMAHLRRAALRECAKLDKLLTQAELGAIKARLAS